MIPSRCAWPPAGPRNATETPVLSGFPRRMTNVRSTFFRRTSFLFITAILSILLFLGPAARLGGTRNICVAYGLSGMMSAPVASYGLPINLVVAFIDSRNKQTKIGMWNEVVNIDPGRANTECKFGITTGLAGETSPLLLFSGPPSSGPLLCVCFPSVSSSNLSGCLQCNQ